MAQPFAQIQEYMLSILLISNLIKGLLLWWSRDMNILKWKNHPLPPPHLAVHGDPTVEVSSHDQDGAESGR